MPHGLDAGKLCDTFFFFFSNILQIILFLPYFILNIFLDISMTVICDLLMSYMLLFLNCHLFYYDSIEWDINLYDSPEMGYIRRIYL